MPLPQSSNRVEALNPDDNLTPGLDREKPLQVHPTPETKIVSSSHYGRFRTLLKQLDQEFVQILSEGVTANVEIPKLPKGIPSGCTSSSEAKPERKDANSQSVRTEAATASAARYKSDMAKPDALLSLETAPDTSCDNEQASPCASKRHTGLREVGRRIESFRRQISPGVDVQATPSENHRLRRSLTELRKASVNHSTSTEWRRHLLQGSGTLSKWRSYILIVVSSSYYEGFFSLCIILNAVTIGMEAEHSLTDFFDYPNFFDLSELVFVIIFTFELLSRILALGLAKAMANPWVRFDFLCVSCGVLDTVFRLFLQGAASDVLSKVIVLRIFRLARLARAARLFVQFRSLWLLVIGMRASINTVLWTFVLIWSISYIFAVLGMETIAPIEASHNLVFQTVARDNFGSLTRAMLTLLQTLTLDSISTVYRPLIQESEGLYQLYMIAYFLTFVLFVSIAAMNLVTAIMVEGSMQQANEDKEALRRWEEQKRKAILPKLRSMFAIIDADNSGEITFEELQSAPQELLAQLQAVTQTADLAEFFYLLDKDCCGSVNIDEFLYSVVTCSSAEAVHSLKVGRLMKQSDRMDAVLRELDKRVIEPALSNAS